MSPARRQHGSDRRTVSPETRNKPSRAGSVCCRQPRKGSPAQAAGRFSDEIVPVTVESKRESVKFDADESVRSDVSLQKLAKLPTVFLEGGTVTPGNACPMN